MTSIAAVVVCAIAALGRLQQVGGRSLKDVETVTNIQGGVGNPQSEYTGLGFNIYTTNETSPFAIGSSTGSTRNSGGTSTLGFWANSLWSLGNNASSSLPFADGSIGTVIVGQPVGIGISTTSLFPTLWTNIQGIPAVDYGNITNGPPGRRRLMQWISSLL